MALGIGAGALRRTTLRSFAVTLSEDEQHEWREWFRDIMVGRHPSAAFWASRFGTFAAVVEVECPEIGDYLGLGQTTSVMLPERKLPPRASPLQYSR